MSSAIFCRSLYALSHSSTPHLDHLEPGGKLCTMLYSYCCVYHPIYFLIVLYDITKGLSSCPQWQKGITHIPVNVNVNGKIQMQLSDSSHAPRFSHFTRVRTLCFAYSTNYSTIAGAYNIRWLDTCNKSTPTFTLFFCSEPSGVPTCKYGHSILL